MMKTALVTGGSRGIGRAVSKKLAGEGFHVLINYLSNDEEAQATLKQITEASCSAELIKFDVSSEIETEKALSHWHEQNSEKHISVLINNAGIRQDNLLVFMVSDEWNKVINTNLNSFYFVTKQVLKNMLLNKFGRIVNIVSLSGIKGLPGQVNYSAAKAALIGATKALAQEVGKKKVTVNAVAPGFIRTDMIKDLDEKELKQLIPLNRFGNTEEVAELVSFLASENSSYITGEVISINGGLYT